MIYSTKKMNSRWDEPPSAMEQYMGDLIHYLKLAVSHSKGLGKLLDDNAAKEKNQGITNLLEHCLELTEMIGEDMTEMVNESFFLIDNDK